MCDKRPMWDSNPFACGTLRIDRSKRTNRTNRWTMKYELASGWWLRPWRTARTLLHKFNELLRIHGEVQRQFDALAEVNERQHTECLRLAEMVRQLTEGGGNACPPD